MTLNEEIKKAAVALGELIKNDEISVTLDHAMEDYERSEELMALISEYNAEQQVLADISEPDTDVSKKVSERIDALYHEITEHPVYAAYIEAKSEFDELYREVMAEVEFGVTGEHPCTHDCSSCGGCHH